MHSELSDEFEVNVRIHQGSVLSPFIFKVVADAVTEFAREGVIGESNNQETQESAQKMQVHI